MSVISRLRPLQESDLPAVVAIEQLVSPSPWTLQQFHESLRDHHAVVLLLNDAVAGFAVWSLVLDEAELLNIAVAPDGQGRGYGQQLLDDLLSQLQPSAAMLFLEVRASNFPAIGFYKRNGFAETGLRRDYYKLAVGREDALLMSLQLTAK